MMKAMKSGLLILLFLVLAPGAQATTLGYFRAEDGPGSTQTTWSNTAAS